MSNSRSFRAASALALCAIACPAADDAQPTGWRALELPLYEPIDVIGPVETSLPLEHAVAPLVISEVRPDQQRLSLTNRGGTIIELTSLEVSSSLQTVTLVGEEVGPFETVELELEMNPSGDAVFVQVQGESGVLQDLQFLPFGGGDPTPPDAGLWHGPAVPLSPGVPIVPANPQTSWLPGSAGSYSSTAPTAMIDGVVSEPDGTPVEGAAVAVGCDPAESFSAGPSSTTVANGAFSLSRPETTLCWARASAPGFATTVRPFFAQSAEPLHLHVQRLSTDAGERVADDTIEFSNGATLTADPADLDANPDLYLTLVAPSALPIGSLIPIARPFGVEVHGADPNAHVVFDHDVATLETPLPEHLLDMAPAGRRLLHPLFETDLDVPGANPIPGGWIEVGETHARLMVSRFSTKVWEEGSVRITIGNHPTFAQPVAGSCTCAEQGGSSPCGLPGVTHTFDDPANFAIDEVRAHGLFNGVEDKIIPAPQSWGEVASVFNYLVRKRYEGVTTNDGPVICGADLLDAPLCSAMERKVDIQYVAEHIQREENAGLKYREQLEQGTPPEHLGWPSHSPFQWLPVDGIMLPITDVICGAKHDVYTEQIDECECNDDPDDADNLQWEVGGEVTWKGPPLCDPPRLGTIVVKSPSLNVDSCEPSEALYALLEDRMVAAYARLESSCTVACLSQGECTGTITGWDLVSTIGTCSAYYLEVFGNASAYCACSPITDGNPIEDPTPPSEPVPPSDSPEPIPHLPQPLPEPGDWEPIPIPGDSAEPDPDPGSLPEPMPQPPVWPQPLPDPDDGDSLPPIGGDWSKPITPLDPTPGGGGQGE